MQEKSFPAYRYLVLPTEFRRSKFVVKTTNASRAEKNPKRDPITTEWIGKVRSLWEEAMKTSYKPWTFYHLRVGQFNKIKLPFLSAKIQPLDRTKYNIYKNHREHLRRIADDIIDHILFTCVRETLQWKGYHLSSKGLNGRPLVFATCLSKQWKP